MPKLIELDQGSKDWHAFRLAHIGSSDVPKILVCDPFAGPTQDFALWLEKTGKKEAKKNENDFTAHGKEKEPVARMQYAAESGEILMPCVLECSAPGWEFLACSLDGAGEDLSLIAEIKCPWDPGTFREAKEGQIPPNYYAQIQHQLFVSGAKRCDYYCWYAEEGITIPVPPNEAYWNETLLPAVKEFWSRVQKKEWPMPIGELRYVSADEAGRLTRIDEGGGKVDFSWAIETPEFLAWAEEMDSLISIARDIEGRTLAHKALGARQYFGNYKKVVGGDLEVSRIHKKSYPMHFTMPESMSMTIKRTGT